MDTTKITTELDQAHAAWRKVDQDGRRGVATTLHHTAKLLAALADLGERPDRDLLTDKGEAALYAAQLLQQTPGRADWSGWCSRPTYQREAVVRILRQNAELVGQADGGHGQNLRAAARLVAEIMHAAALDSATDDALNGRR